MLYAKRFNQFLEKPPWGNKTQEKTVSFIYQILLPSGISVQAVNIAAQPVGFAAGVKAAEERIQIALKNIDQHSLPVVAVENFILEVGEDK